MKLLLQQVKEIVIQAADLLEMNTMEVHHKGTKENYVTSVDINIQKFLNQKLVALIPHSVVYGEENDALSISDYTWIVDPIDGTANLTRDIPNFAISVALMIHRELVLGIVYSPKTHELFEGLKGHGAFLNGKPIQASNQPFSESMFCTSMSIYKKELARLCIDIIEETYMLCSDIRRFGSCALELCYIAAGRVDLYFEIRVFPWDYAAAAIILQEAHGVFGTIRNFALTHDKPVPLIATNTKENFHQLKEIIDKHISDMPYE